MSARKVTKWLLLTGLLCCTGAQAADTAQQLVDQGNSYWAENKLELAEQQYLQAMQADPESRAAHRQLASLYLAQNKTGQAIEAYQNAITLDPENASLFVGICLAYMHQGAYSRSHAMCSQALRLNPDLENAQKLQAYIQAKLAAQNETQPMPHPATGGTQMPETVKHAN